MHPKADEVEGLASYRSIDDLPAAPDASFIGVNRELTVDVVRHLAEAGAGGAVAYASGFKESGENGKHLQAALVQAAGTMPVLGPNCYGVINYLDGALLWPDQHGGNRAERGVALIMQSSNIALNLTMNRRALPIAYVICLGNQASVGLADVMRAVADDPRVSAVGLYVEGIGDAARFADAALDLAGRDLPIVTLLGGRSEAGAKQAVSHTASLVGDGAVMSAYLAYLGISEVTSPAVLLETLKLLHVHGRLAGGRVLSLSCSGGEAALIADSGADGKNISFPPFSDIVREKIAKTTHPLVTVSNPFDYHTFDWGRPDRLKATFDAVLAADVDIAALVWDWPRDDRTDPKAWQAPLDVWRDALHQRKKTGAVIAMLPENLTETIASELIDQGIAPLQGIPDALQAIDAAARQSRDRSRPALPVSADSSRWKGAIVTLDEQAAKTKLKDAGIAVPDGERVTTIEAAVQTADRIGYPVVLKVLGLAHKTEVSAVRLDLRTAEAVKSAAKELLERGKALLVERQIEDGVAELIVGASIDPAIGLHLVIGSGGILVELVNDSEVLILPASRASIRSSLSRLKAASLLAGYRGKPAGDVEAAIDAIFAIQAFLSADHQQVVEMDINPLIVRPKGQGAVAVDALIRTIQPPCEARSC